MGETGGMTGRCMGSILLPPYPGRGPGLLPGRATGARVVLTPSHGSTYDSEMLNRLHRPAPWRMWRGIQLADRVAMARSHRGGTMRAWVYLVGFILLVIIWRLPVMVNTLARHPVLTIAEAVTLVAAGCGLWLELLESAPMLPTISRPQRAAFAALPMWTIWTLAYIMGFSRGVWFTAFAHRPGAGLGTAADQQIAAAILWAVPAVCFVPVVYFSLITWLRDSSEPAAELREAAVAYGGLRSATRDA